MVGIGRPPGKNQQQGQGLVDLYSEPQDNNGPLGQASYIQGQGATPASARNCHRVPINAAGTVQKASDKSTIRRKLSYEEDGEHTKTKKGA